MSVLFKQLEKLSICSFVINNYICLQNQWSRLGRVITVVSRHSTSIKCVLVTNLVDTLTLTFYGVSNKSKQMQV